MKSTHINKSVVYAVIIFVVAIIAYNYLWKSSMESTTAGLSAQDAGNDVVTLNQSLQAVTFDESLFSSREYRALVDWSPSLSKGQGGRTNPFAPIGQ